MGRSREVSAALWKRLGPLLPKVKPSPAGGRSRLNDELALNGIIFVLRTGISWEDMPQEMGFGSDLLGFFEPFIPIKRLRLGWMDVAA
jgi:transposase